MSLDALLPLLACPACGGYLACEQEELRCRGCSLRYPVTRGVPRLVWDGARRTVEATADSFGHEFTKLDPLDEPAVKKRQDVITFFRATGLDAEIYRHVANSEKRKDLTPEEIGYEPDARMLSGKLVLDAGCGAGRFTKLLAGYGARVVALDISEAIDRVATELRGNENVSPVQGNILHPPLCRGAFDYVFSIGVLQHTPNTRLGLEALARLLKPGGTLHVWVYSDDYWGGPVKRVVTHTIRKLLLRLPVKWRARFCERVLLPIGLLQMALARRQITKLLAAPLFALNIPRYPDRRVMLSTIFDYWATPVIRTHTSEELYDWFAQLGFVDIQILPLPTAVRGRRPST